LTLITGCALLAVPALALAVPRHAATTTARRPAPVNTRPAIEPAHGRPFVPAQGDWEGTARGLAASFQLSFDERLAPRPGVPQYGVSHVVLLLPDACPVSAADYNAEEVSASIPTQIGAHGALTLTKFGVRGALTSRRTATISVHYRSAGCSGTLTWTLHPASRVTVDDGSWTARFADGERERFSVTSAGRLAEGLNLPNMMQACGGVQGTLVMFIPADGVATFDNADLKATLRFSAATAGGTLNSSAGCPGGPIHFSATRDG
jgi:hypothetical protein